jgi:hypothetical protein
MSITTETAISREDPFKAKRKQWARSWNTSQGAKEARKRYDEKYPGVLRCAIDISQTKKNIKKKDAVVKQLIPGTDLYKEEHTKLISYQMLLENLQIKMKDLKELAEMTD